MSNVLGDEKKQSVLTLGRLGWSLRRIEESTGIRRETASAYLKAAGIAVRGRGGRPGTWPPKPATTPGVSTDPQAKPATTEGVSTDPGGPKPAISGQVSTDSGPSPWPPPPGRAPRASACEPFRELIAEALSRGRNAKAIWQDLVDDHGFVGRYSSVKRFVVKLRGTTAPEARVVITTAPGEEGLCGIPHSPSYAVPENMRRPQTPIAFWAATSNPERVGRRIVTGLPRRRGVRRSADICRAAFSAVRFARELSP